MLVSWADWFPLTRFEFFWVLTFGVIIYLLYTLNRARIKLGLALASIQKAQESFDQSVAVLSSLTTIIKSWTVAQSEGAKITVREVREATKSQTTEIKQALAEIPPKTAEAVAQTIADGKTDSGTSPGNGG